MSQYVVSTLYLSKPGGRPIAHVYGPMSEAAAISLRNRFRMDNDPLKPGQFFNASVCKIIDPSQS